LVAVSELVVVVVVVDAWNFCFLVANGGRDSGGGSRDW
jgi:hypothetical protein